MLLVHLGVEYTSITLFLFGYEQDAGYSGFLELIQ